jgi:hypothetical protein
MTKRVTSFFTWNGCPPGYTIQVGACMRYRRGRKKLSIDLGDGVPRTRCRPGQKFSERRKSDCCQRGGPQRNNNG